MKSRTIRMRKYGKRNSYEEERAEQGSEEEDKDGLGDVKGKFKNSNTKHAIVQIAI
jgi:hypothetical protein